MQPERQAHPVMALVAEVVGEAAVESQEHLIAVAMVAEGAVPVDVVVRVPVEGQEVRDHLVWSW